MRNLIGLLAAAAIIVPASAGAQDKGGLAETYKALCSDAAAAATEACVALRQSMTGATTATVTTATAYSPTQSAVALPELPAKPVREAVIEAVDAAGAARLPDYGDAAANAEAWGPLAVLGGTYWLNERTGGIRHYRWMIPGEVLEYAASTGELEFADRISLDATGTTLRATGKTANGESYSYVVRSPRFDVSVSENAEAGWRQTERYSGARRIGQYERLKNGAWVIEGESTEGRRLSVAQAKAGMAVLAEYRAASTAHAEAVAAAKAAKTAADQAALAKVWGVLPKLAGTMWRRDNSIWSFYWNEHAKRYTIQTYLASGQTNGYWEFRAYDGGRLYTNTGVRVPVLPDGSIFLDETDDALILRDDNTLVFENGRMSGGGYYRVEGQTSGWNGSFAKLSPDQRQAMLAQAQRFKQQQAAAEAAQQSSGGGGGGGLFGALLGAGMGAMMGGNTEQVMGAAIKGVQIVDPGSQVGQAFGSQADAMVSGQGLNAGNALMSNMGLGGVTGATVGGGGSYATKPNLAAGSCPGFNESNYRSVALSGGNDVQLKTMCGQAFEYYTMYKRAIAQGYAEADANRTYAAHEGAVANLRSFAGN